MKYKVFSKKQWEELLTSNGYYYDRTNGSHMIYKNNLNDTIITPKSLNPMILRRTIKEHKLKEIK